MSKKHIKVAVTGAAGQIGYALIFRIASGQMFGPDVDVSLQLLELPQALPSLEGVHMELDDCAFPLLRGVVCTDDPKVAFKDANWVLLVGAVPRKQGMERSDLLQINGKIFGPTGRAINEVAAPDVNVFVVGNPCNTNCLITMHAAKDIPRNRFYAMTMLDEKRSRMQLALKAKVPVTAVSQMTIWGNHSATQYPDFYHAKINGKPVTEVIKDEAWLQGEFIDIIQQRGAVVIKARGASSAASAANAVIGGVHSLIFDTPAGESFSVCKYSEGEYGVDKGLIFSFPCVVQHGKLSVVQGLTHNAFGAAKFNATLDELRKERDTVKGMGLLD